MSRLPFRITLSALGTLAVLCAAGCGGANGGTISGAVTLNGEPVKGGQVAACNDKGDVVASAMIEDGKYELTNVPPGKLAMVVRTHTPDGQQINYARPLREGEKPGVLVTVDPKDKDNPPKVVLFDPVPLKYTDPKQSGLSADVTKGGTTKVDIAMTGKGEIPKAPPPGPQPGGPGQPGGPIIPPPMPPR